MGDMVKISSTVHVSHIEWSHMSIGLAFVAFNVAISYVLKLHVGAGLVIAALRCMAQLMMVATVLQQVLAVKTLWAVAGIACAFFLAEGVILTCAMGVDLLESAAEYSRHVRNWCVVAGLSRRPLVLQYYVSHHQGQKKVSTTYGACVYHHVPTGRQCESVDPFLACRFQFTAVLAAMLLSTTPVSVLGEHFAMDVVPFWTPDQYRK